MGNTGSYLIPTIRRYVVLPILLSADVLRREDIIKKVCHEYPPHQRLINYVIIIRATKEVSHEARTEVTSY